MCVWGGGGKGAPSLHSLTSSSILALVWSAQQTSTHAEMYTNTPGEIKTNINHHHKRMAKSNWRIYFTFSLVRICPEKHSWKIAGSGAPVVGSPGLQAMFPLGDIKRFVARVAPAKRPQKRMATVPSASLKLTVGYNDPQGYAKLRLTCTKKNSVLLNFACDESKRRI